jgi:intracellular septation protein
MPADYKEEEVAMTPVDSAPLVAPQPNESWLPLALDFGPLLVFFVIFKMVGFITATAAFMAAIIVAVIVSKIKLGRIAPMLWLSATLVLFFGSLTIYFNDFRFIQHKPTIIYAFFAVMLLGGYLRRKPLLKYLLQAAYNGLDEQGWLKLSRNWGYFFLVMAIANELMVAWLTKDQWVTIKVWGVTFVSMAFAAANVPMLLRHGLDVGQKQPEHG